MSVFSWAVCGGTAPSPEPLRAQFGLIQGMSTNTSQPRQPKGVPSGGQWRATTRPEGRACLAEPATDRASMLWALVGRLDRGEERQLEAEAVDEEDAYSSAQLVDDIQSAKQLRRIAEVLSVMVNEHVRVV